MIFNQFKADRLEYEGNDNLQLFKWDIQDWIDNGNVLGRLTLGYDMLLTQRLIFHPRVEANKIEKRTINAHP